MTHCPAVHFDLLAAQEEAAKLSIHAAAQLAGFLAVVGLVRWWVPKLDPIATADNVFGVVFYPALAGAALLASWDLRQDHATRWAGASPAAEWFARCFVARCLTHTVVMLFYRKMKIGELVLMLLHHLLSGACFGHVLVVHRGYFWASLAGCCEVTNVFLSILFTMRELTYRGSPLQEVFPTVYVINGTLLFLSFAVLRLALFPVWLRLYFIDLATYPAETAACGDWVDLYLNPGVIGFLLLLSTYWMVPITKGLMKALGLSQKQK